MTTPRIYVACLASYNNGKLHGAWIDCEDHDDVNERIQAMLIKSPYPNVTVKCPTCEGTGASGGNRHLPAEAVADCNACKGAGTMVSAEEWAIHDSEGFGDYDVSSDIGELCEVAKMIAEHGELFCAVMAHFGCDATDAQMKLRDEFRGQYSSFRDFSDELADEMISQETKSTRFLARYFDYEAFARDLQHDYYVIEHDGSVYVFDQ